MPPTFLEKGNRSQYETLLDKYDTWLFDCDGVLWNGDQLVDGSKEVLGMLRRQSARVIFPG
jgi:4-nitrophenyl phosphatase